MRKYRRKIYLIIAVITFLMSLLILMNLRTQVSESDPKKRPNKEHLLIISTWRSGSSLVGELFNQNPDVFYLKEPAWHVWTSMPYIDVNVLNMAVAELIRSLFTCDMSVMDLYLEEKSFVSNFFRWSYSRALCSPPVCNNFSQKVVVPETDCEESCSKSPFSKVEESCKNYSHVVLQEFRIFDLKVLYPLLTDPALNLKILHVVRDPRAIAKSREQLKIHLNFDNSIIVEENENALMEDEKPTGNADSETVLAKICRSQVDMYKTSKDRPPPFLEDRYMLLRYDDLVRDPKRAANQIYAFAGLKLTEDLKTWIYKMTHGEGRQSENPYSIRPLNALNVSLDWKNVLTFEEITSVQKICKDFMDYFGYQNIESKDELNDVNFNPVLLKTKNDSQ